MQTPTIPYFKLYSHAEPKQNVIPVTAAVIKPLILLQF